jgi:PhzF family phenazine biosynthesis protein
MPREFLIIDAFSTAPYTGSPAGVVLDARGLDENRMQTIAGEFNLAATAFVSPTDSVASRLVDDSALPGSTISPIRLRWFTPAVELTMCGHGTLAATHALVESGSIPWDDNSSCVELPVDCKAGCVTVFVERWPGEGGGRIYWIEMIPPTFTSFPLSAEESAQLIGCDPEAIELIPAVKTQDRDLLVLVKNVLALNGATPDFHQIARFSERHDVRGICVATMNTLSPSVHVQKRYFAPSLGINEDIATGSVHGPLCVYLVKYNLVPLRDGTAAIVCVQGKPGGRASLQYGLVKPLPGDRYNVRVGGRATTVVRGQVMCE